MSEHEDSLATKVFGESVLKEDNRFSSLRGLAHDETEIFSGEQTGVCVMLHI
jgi:hypothetical protein